MPKWEALHGENRALAWYLLQNTRFRRIRNFMKNRCQNAIQNRWKSEPRAPEGRTFRIFGGIWRCLIFCFLGAAKSQSKIRKTQIFWSKGPNFQDFGSARRNARCPRRGKERLKTSPVLASFRNRKFRNRKKSLARCALPAEGAAERASAHSAGPVYGFVSLWCVGLIIFSFCDQILFGKPTCEDRFQILCISCTIQPEASEMFPKWSQKGPTWSQQGPTWSQKGQTLTKRAPKGD